MRRVVCLLLSLCILAVGGEAFALWNKHLNGDPNFVFIDGHMETAWYLDRTSMVIKKDTVEERIIAINVITARSAIGDENNFFNGGQGAIVDVQTKTFLYDIKNRKMYTMPPRTDAWKYIDPNPDLPLAYTRVTRPAAEMTFALAYNLRFYGSFTYYSAQLGKRMHIFSDAFYEPLAK